VPKTPIGCGRSLSQNSTGSHSHYKGDIVRRVKHLRRLQIHEHGKDHLPAQAPAKTEADMKEAVG